jgi:hypothetical protein
LSVAAPGPNQGRFGTLGRNSFRGPAYYNYDFAFIKRHSSGAAPGAAPRWTFSSGRSSSTCSTSSTWAAGQHARRDYIPMRGGNAATISRTNGFGQISKTAGNSRQIQFSLKLIY